MNFWFFFFHSSLSKTYLYLRSLNTSAMLRSMEELRFSLASCIFNCGPVFRRLSLAINNLFRVLLERQTLVLGLRQTCRSLSCQQLADLVLDLTTPNLRAAEQNVTDLRVSALQGELGVMYAGMLVAGIALVSGLLILTCGCCVWKSARGVNGVLFVVRHLQKEAEEDCFSKRKKKKRFS